MRIEVIGDNAPAKAIRKGLNLEGFVTDGPGTHKLIVEVDDKSTHAYPAVDGIDSELERTVVTCVAKIANTPVLLLRPGGVQSEDNLRLVLPKALVVSDPKRVSLIEEGVVKGYGLLLTRKTSAPKKSRFRFWLGLFLLLSVSNLNGQTAVVVRFTDANGNLITGGDNSHDSLSGLEDGLEPFEQFMLSATFAKYEKRYRFMQSEVAVSLRSVSGTFTVKVTFFN